ncbi:MAG: response regulator [Thermodesulfobacteriota bacterium]
MKKQAKSEFRITPWLRAGTYGVTFVILASALGALFLAYDHSVELRFLERLKAGEMEHLRLARETAGRVLVEVLSDLMALAWNRTVQDYLEVRTGPAAEAVEYKFRAFSKAKGRYDQIRIIAKDGWEILRVNYSGGESLIVPRDRLQDKGQRYYFQRVMELGPNQVYISPLDLNVENGVIEKPYKPTLRLATPLFDRKGERAAILVLNYLGDSFFVQLLEILHGTRGRAMLINRDGYWLLGSPSGEDWGFMFEDRKNAVFKRDFPLSWPAVSTRAEGQFTNREGLFSFVSLTSGRLPPGLERAGVRTAVVPGERDQEWKLISYLPPEQVRALTAGALPNPKWYFLVMAVAAALISWLLAEAWLKRRRAEALQQALALFPRENPNPVLRVSPDRRLLFANPGATPWLEAWGVAVGERLPEDWGPLLEESRRTGAFKETHLSLGGRDYSIMVAPVSDLDSLYIYGRDITLQKRAEEELARYQRHLEDLVADRTAELVEAKTRLEKEIVERSEAQARISDREARLRAVFQTAAYAIVTMDERGLIESLNPAAEKMFGRSSSELAGQNVGRLMPEPDRGRHDEYLARYISSGRAAPNHDRREVFGLRADGTRFPLELTVSEMIVGGRRMFTGILRDVTEKKKAEKELEEAKVQAEAANRAKSEFLANMSHEIRTPLNAIIGMTELALSTSLDEEQRDFLRTVKISADALLDLVSEILDFSKIEAGYLKLEVTDFDLRALLESTLKGLAVKAHEKGLELAGHMPPELPVWFKGDPHRLRQVIVNLVGNAIKFTERGEVVVNVELETGPGDGDRLHFTVSDTGIGIPPERLDRIFDRFTQVDGSTTRRYGGTGLGTTISKQLVELMGGRIWAESEAGRGSEFHFTVPAEAGHPSETFEAPLTRDLEGLRVLVVDDNATNRLIVREHLTGWGVYPVEASGGAEALRKLDDIEATGGVVNLALLDVNMPGMNGFELARAIREKAKWAGLPIVFLTSGAGREEHEAAGRPEGAVFLTKPVRQAEILEAVLSALGRRARRREGPSEAIRPGAVRLKVLLAEDNLFNQKLAVTLLSKRGHQVETAGNGFLALEAFRRGGFDVVLLDVHMPEMDGLEAARRMRALEKETGGHVPIVAMTALATPEDRDRCLEAGMDSFISKPIHREELLSMVEGLAAAGAPKTPVPAPRTEEVLNRKALDILVDGDQNLLRELVGLFQRDLSARLAAIEAAVKEKEPRTLEQTAHALKGAALNLTAGAVARAALKLEQAGRQGLLAGTEELFQDLLEEIARLKPALADISGPPEE